LYSTRLTRPKYLFHEKRSLEKFYASNPWPYNAVLREIASELDMYAFFLASNFFWLVLLILDPSRSFETVYEWFAKRRARAIGLKSGVVDTLPNMDECPSRMSWQLYVAEFGNEEYRANVIHAFQHPMASPKLRSKSTSWRQGLEAPPKEPSWGRARDLPKRQHAKRISTKK